MGVSQGEYDTLLWYRGPILHRQAFSKGIYCMVLMKSHYMNQIHNTSLAINRLCFTKNRKWRWKAWWKAYRRKLIDTCYTSNIFIHCVRIWLLDMLMITSWNRKYLYGVHRLIDIQAYTQTHLPFLQFLHIIKKDNKIGVTLLSHGKENDKIKPSWLWLCPVGILIDS